MQIHQMQVRYEALADRLLMQVRTRASEVFAVWLTRRMMQRFWPTFHRVATQMPVAGKSPGALLAPEAQAMLAESALQRPLAGADFNQPFGSPEDRQPMGAEPMLASEIQLQSDPKQGLRLALSDAQGRHLTLQLSEDMVTALLRLVEKALADADWGLAAPAIAAADTAPGLAH